MRDLQTAHFATAGHLEMIVWPPFSGRWQSAHWAAVVYAGPYADGNIVDAASFDILQEARDWCMKVALHEAHKILKVAETARFPFVGEPCPPSAP